MIKKFFLFLLIVSCAGPVKTEKPDLNGKWTSSIDTLHYIEIDKERWKMGYGGFGEDSYFYKVRNGEICLYNESDTLLYEILDCSRTHLSLRYVVKGNIIEYTK